MIAVVLLFLAVLVAGFAAASHAPLRDQRDGLKRRRMERTLMMLAGFCQKYKLGGGTSRSEGSLRHCFLAISASF